MRAALAARSAMFAVKDRAVKPDSGSELDIAAERRRTRLGGRAFVPRRVVGDAFAAHVVPNHEIWPVE